MFRLLRLSFLVVATVLTVQSLVGTPVALGASASATQNPDFTVTLSLPDEATLGDTVAATVTIVNNTRSVATFTARGTWTDPAGVATVTTKNGMLVPGQSITRVIDYAVDEKVVAGTHEVTVTVENGHGTSSATANIQIV
jgi:hypothetical protein